MTQPSWHRRARELLPEFLPRESAARSLHDLGLDLYNHVRFTEVSPDLMGRIFVFVNYCLASARGPSVQRDIVDGFVRHVITDERLQHEAAQHLIIEPFPTMQLISESMPQDAFDAFIRIHGSQRRDRSNPSRPIS